MPSSPYTDEETKAAAKSKEPETEPVLIATVSEAVRKQRQEMSLKQKQSSEELNVLNDIKEVHSSAKASDGETCESMLKEVLGKPNDFNKPRNTKNEKKESNDKNASKQPKKATNEKKNDKKKEDQKADNQKKETNDCNDQNKNK